MSTRKPWADRAPVEPVTHEAQPSGLLGAYGRVSRPSVLEVVERAARITGGVVRLDAAPWWAASELREVG